MLPALIVSGYHVKNTMWDSFSSLANNCWKVNELIILYLAAFICHSFGSKHAGPLIFCCSSLLPYRLLMTTAFPFWSAACKVSSLMIPVMTNWKPSSWLCLVYKWSFSVLDLITQMILTLFLCIPWWIAGLWSVSPELKVPIRDQFCTFQLSVSMVVVDQINDPRSALLLWAAWRKQKQAPVCDEVSHLSFECSGVLSHVCGHVTKVVKKKQGE